MSPAMRAAVARLLASREAQGLPPLCSDPATLVSIAAVLRTAGDDGKRGQINRESVE